MSKPLWTPDWSRAPRGTIGASFNLDGKYWFWSVHPEVKGSETKPWLLLWRGPVEREGYTFGGTVPEGTYKYSWKYSWLDAPKAKKW